MHPLREFGIKEIRQIDETANRYHGTENTNIFHGRDLFAYCAVRLDAGVITYEQVAPTYPVEEVVQFPIAFFSAKEGYAEGSVTGALVPFGNLNTSIPAAAFEKSGIRSGDHVMPEIRRSGEVRFSKTVIYHQFFAFAGLGQEIEFNNYSNFLGIAINWDNFAETHQIGNGPDWTVVIGKAGQL